MRAVTRPLAIGRVVEATGVPARTIRYYEKVGVLPTPARTAAGYRQYSEAAVARLRFVRRARALGLPLRTLKTLVAALDGESRAAVRPRLRALVRDHLSSVQRQIADLRSLEAELRSVLRRTAKTPHAGHASGCRCLEPERRR